MYQQATQGSVLGPLLFSVFVNDVSWVHGVRLSIRFGDYTEIFTSESNAGYTALRLQRQLDAYIGWFDS